MKGTIIKVLGSKGYGFIQPEDHDDGEEIFFHHTQVVERRLDSLKPGWEVEFEKVETDRGPQANNVTVINDDGSSSLDDEAEEEETFFDDDDDDDEFEEDLEEDLDEESDYYDDEDEELDDTEIIDEDAMW